MLEDSPCFWLTAVRVDTTTVAKTASTTACKSVLMFSMSTAPLRPPNSVIIRFLNKPAYCICHIPGVTQHSSAQINGLKPARSHLAEAARIGRSQPSFAGERALGYRAAQRIPSAQLIPSLFGLREKLCSARQSELTGVKIAHLLRAYPQGRSTLLLPGWNLFLVAMA